MQASEAGALVWRQELAFPINSLASLQFLTNIFTKSVVSFYSPIPIAISFL
jgi:hypothetical protein